METISPLEDMLFDLGLIDEVAMVKSTLYVNLHNYWTRNLIILGV